MGVAVLTTSALLIGFSVWPVEHVVMAIVDKNWSAELTFRTRKRRLIKNNVYVGVSPMMSLLPCLSCGVPIIGVPGHPHRDVAVVGRCLPSGEVTASVVFWLSLI